jgi:hypothetical protein
MTKLGKKLAIDHDELQWIVRRGHHAIAFVSSTRAILIRCLTEAGLEAAEAARATAGRLEGSPAQPYARGSLMTTKAAAAGALDDAAGKEPQP